MGWYWKGSWDAEGKGAGRYVVAVAGRRGASSTAWRAQWGKVPLRREEGCSHHGSQQMLGKCWHKAMVGAAPMSLSSAAPRAGAEVTAGSLPAAGLAC